jgi:threonine aldolase
MIDLRSDTVTRPTPGMRRAIAEADVGDDVLGDDPTVRRLEERIAGLLNKEAAALFPSGIMANLAAMHVVAERGTEVVIEAMGHILDWEVGGATAVAGVLLRRVTTDDGLLTAAHVEAAIRPGLKYQIKTSAITLENTHNGAGGKIMPIAEMQKIAALGRSRGLRIHLDGARLWNASAASGVPLADYGACADTVTVALSKGLGCPIGSVLAGSAQLMDEARLIRRRLGGAMRQSGILAAAGLYALDHHLTRLNEDHANATLFAQRASEIDGLSVAMPDTNIVMLDVMREGLSAMDIVSKMGERGVALVPFTPARVRAVTHMDVNRDQIEEAAEQLKAVMS